MGQLLFSLSNNLESGGIRQLAQLRQAVANG